MSDKLMNRAIFWTTIWVILVVLMSGYNFWFRPDIIHLNEIGDFVAGAMSPLAIFWLVMVYLQQRTEMSEISEHAEEQVKIMDKQFKKQYEPLLVCISLISDANKNIVLFLRNFGEVALNIKIHPEDESNSETLEGVSLWNVTDRPPGHGDGFSAISGFGIVEKDKRIRIKFVPRQKDGEGFLVFSIIFKDLINRKIILKGKFKWDGKTNPEDVFLEGANIVP